VEASALGLAGNSASAAGSPWVVEVASAVALASVVGSASPWAAASESVAGWASAVALLSRWIAVWVCLWVVAPAGESASP